MRTSVDSGMVYDVVPQSDDDSHEDDTDRDDSVWLKRVSANLKDRILRSELCRQPAGNDQADEIIVDSVMTLADKEAAKAAMKAATVDDWSPVTVTTDSSSDLD